MQERTPPARRRKNGVDFRGMASVKRLTICRVSWLDDKRLSPNALGVCSAIPLGGSRKGFSLEAKEPHMSPSKCTRCGSEFLAAGCTAWSSAHVIPSRRHQVPHFRDRGCHDEGDHVPRMWLYRDRWGRGKAPAAHLRNPECRSRLIWGCRRTRLSRAAEPPLGGPHESPGVQLLWGEQGGWRLFDSRAIRQEILPVNTWKSPMPGTRL